MLGISSWDEGGTNDKSFFKEAVVRIKLFLLVP